MTKTIQRAVFALVMLTLCNCVHARTWRTRDYALESVFAATMYADYQQTAQIVVCGRCKPDGLKHFETNPIMGPHGENVSPSTYFAGAMLTHVLVTTLLPDNWRTIFQTASIAVEGRQIYINYTQGFNF